MNSHLFLIRALASQPDKLDECLLQLSPKWTGRGPYVPQFEEYIIRMLDFLFFFCCLSLFDVSVLSGENTFRCGCAATGGSNSTLSIRPTALRWPYTCQVNYACVCVIECLRVCVCVQIKTLANVINYVKYFLFYDVPIKRAK